MKIKIVLKYTPIRVFFSGKYFLLYVILNNIVMTIGNSGTTFKFTSLTIKLFYETFTENNFALLLLLFCGILFCTI